MMLVATMNIKDPDVRELAVELAKRRRTSLTDAVRQALTEAIARDRRDRADYVDRVMASAHRFRAEMDRLGVEPLTDEDLYDAMGLPR